MSDKMTPISFGQLLSWIVEEKKKYNTVFGIHKAFIANQEHALFLLGGKMETPIGPAAGPHTQLAQNIIGAYYAGSRFFELKTVQILDGEDLPVNKPCIRAEDECYNVEWSTELYVSQAFEEYVKAWFVLKLISKEFGLGAPDGFLFNMSVGYDLEGIKTKKIDDFIEGLKDASETEVFKLCKAYALEHVSLFQNVTAADIEAISPNICNSITLSTLHGCPPQEIERIASYLMTKKQLHTFIKCNPTLLGYEYARMAMDSLGYDYISFGDFHFKDDLQYEDALPMLRRLMDLAAKQQLCFGVKITNTFPVDVKNNELPGEEMYMSGRSLYPLSIAVAAKLAGDFDGELQISYSGGADMQNIKGIFDAGIQPITMATTVLKPGGYQRFTQIAELLGRTGYNEIYKVNAERVEALAKEGLKEEKYRKAVKPLPSRKIKKAVPIFDCFMAPCEEGCPIHQDITSYMKLAGEARYAEALRVIIEKNPLPFITGNICAHRCMEKCTRNFYEEAVHIRDTKLKAARGGYEELLKQCNPTVRKNNRKIAVVGGGPAGLAAAFFLSRAGEAVTIFEKKAALGGIVRHIIPEFRISLEEIEKDTALAAHMGVEVRLNTTVASLEELRVMGYDAVILAIGAQKSSTMKLNGTAALNALTFLEDYKKTAGQMNLGRSIAVIGGGNTAMDTARAAKRIKGVDKVSIVYRRTIRYMPAAEDELMAAEEEGVEFKELLVPVSIEQGELICHKAVLGEADEAGRRTPVETEEVVIVSADTVIAALGEKIDTELYRRLDISLDKKGAPIVDEQTMESNIKGVYVIGDGVKGPATVVEAIKDAGKAAKAISGNATMNIFPKEQPIDSLYDKKGIIMCADETAEESQRCLVCSAVCENCVDVCPNRANIAVQIPDKHMTQIVHLDKLCNECGNCLSFCPYDSAPYLHKFTLFQNEEDFVSSKNQGFVITDINAAEFKIRWNGEIKVMTGFEEVQGIDANIIQCIRTLYQNYSYVW